MKSFLVGTALAVALAIASGFVLEGYFAQTAVDRFSAPSARVDEPVGGHGVQEIPADTRG